ncbi:hypothetical protein [Alcanivorax sp.]|uniref:hypothetical protein n=1 Tax=Alcanivorax sp. TaxID=1872427 RepID=UPI002B2758F9|nr:hypothetical protein [Alcanivorax sp.]
MNRPATSNCRRQQGALTVITPLLLVIVVILSVMALDGARLYMLRGEMQAQVNVAAQAGAAEAQSCGGQFVSTAVIQARALAAAQAQGFNAEDGTLEVQVGLIEDADDSDVLSFRPVNVVQESNAVLVTYTRSEPISLLLPASTFGTLDMSVNAAARKQVVATMSAAGSTATVDSGIVGSLLGAVLGDDGYTLDPTSLDSLRNTTIKLGDLLTEVGVADVAELLDLDGAVLASALRDVAGAASPAGEALDDLLGATGLDTVQVSEVLEVVEGTQVPTNSEFPLYDMLISLVLNVAETQQDSLGAFLEVPLDIDLDLSPVANVQTSVELNVGEAPRIKIGPVRQDVNGEWVTKFYAPDISLLIDAEVELLGLGALLNLATVDLPLAVNAGGAEIEFVSADCAAGSNNNVEIGVNINRSVARLGTGTLDSDSGEIVPDQGSLQVLGLLGLRVLSANVFIDGEVPGVSDRGVIIAEGYPLYCSDIGCTQQTFSDNGDGVTGLELDIQLRDLNILGILPLDLTFLTNLLEDLLSTVVEALAGSLINPLLEALGIGLGGVTITVTGASQNSSQVLENIVVMQPGN